MAEPNEKTDEKLDRSDKVLIALSFLIRLSLVVAAVEAVLDARWMVLFVTTITLVLSFLPSLIEHNYRVNLPLEMELTIVIFVYATLFLGEVKGYYTRFWWWDIVLHTGSALAFGVIGFLIIYLLLLRDKLRARPWLAAVFAFSFAVSIGALWEIFEFAADNLLGLNMQKSGLVDTMVDLIVDCIGAFIAAFGGYLYLKHKKTRFVGHMIDRFIIENPHLSNPVVSKAPSQED